MPYYPNGGISVDTHQESDFASLIMNFVNSA